MQKKSKLRNEWVALKKKHKLALTGVKFKDGLGPQIDILCAKITLRETQDPNHLTNIAPVMLDAAKETQKICKKYLKIVGNLTNLTAASTS